MKVILKIVQQLDAFICIAGSILLLTALAKIISAMGGARVLELQDPVFFISFRDLFWTVGTLELIAAILCLFWRKRLLQLFILAWLSTCFLIYRIALYWINYTKPCPCLGNLTGAIHLTPQAAESVMTTIMMFLLFGSYAGIFCVWLSKSK